MTPSRHLSPISGVFTEAEIAFLEMVKEGLLDARDRKLDGEIDFRANFKQGGITKKRMVVQIDK
jgi:hypothetical protein